MKFCVALKRRIFVFSWFDRRIYFNPLTAGAVHIRFLYFLLAYYISAFKHNKDKK